MSRYWHFTMYYLILFWQKNHQGHLSRFKWLLSQRSIGLTHTQWSSFSQHGGRLQNPGALKPGRAAHPVLAKEMEVDMKRAALWTRQFSACLTPPHILFLFWTNLEPRSEDGRAIGWKPRCLPESLFRRGVWPSKAAHSTLGSAWVRSKSPLHEITEISGFIYYYGKAELVYYAVGKG